MLQDLTTESRNPASNGIDLLSSLEIVRLMNDEDTTVAAAVGSQAETIALAVDMIADRIGTGGRLVYQGAGTSGRLGVLDASECPPTFNTPPELVVGLIAGGSGALTRSIEGAEDDPRVGGEDLRSISFSNGDVLVGIATSGRTPYVIGGLKYARSLGAATIGLSCNEQSALANESDFHIAPIVGPEVISGSTRLKAGTATKMVLNILTTAAMVRLGKTFGNLMVDLRATNSKLTDRAGRIVSTLTGLPLTAAQQWLDLCNGELKTAIVAQQRSVEPAEARELLSATAGHLRQALEMSQSESRPGSPEDQVRQPTVNKVDGQRDLVIGIDGGGTKTVAWLAEKTATAAQVLGRGASGPSNPCAVGFEPAMRSLESAIKAALADANRTPAEITTACLALAGSGFELESKRIPAWIRQRGLARQVVVTNDAEPILACAAADGWGVALIAGTGSFVLARDQQGKTARVGGWGFRFGDEGSGYAIAVHGLTAAARAADGRGPSTVLLDQFLDHFQAQQPRQLIEKTYSGQVDRRVIADCARLVFEAAGEDRVADQIVSQAADSLTELIVAARYRLQLPNDLPLGVAGGAILGSNLLLERFLEQLADRNIRPTPLTRVPHPVQGTLLMARR